MRILTKSVSAAHRTHYYLFGIKIASIPDNSWLRRRFQKFSKDGPPVLIIRRSDMGAGLFAHFATNLGWMKWALDHGYKPFVDMQEVPNLINRGICQPHVNPWTFFFSQCDDIDVLDALRARHVKVAPERWLPGPWPNTNPGLLVEGNERLTMWRTFIAQHIRVADGIRSEVDAYCRDNFPQDGRVLGCLVRGTDYTKIKPRWHQIQPTPEQVVADAKKVCAEQGVSHVFLATEDEKARHAFREAFGDRLLTYQTALPKYTGNGFLVSSGSMGDGARSLEVSRQYMVSVMILSRCTHFLAGCTSGSVGAVLFSSGFQWSRVYDLGIYE